MLGKIKKKRINGSPSILRFKVADKILCEFYTKIERFSFLQKFYKVFLILLFLKIVLIHFLEIRRENRLKSEYHITSTLHIFSNSSIDPFAQCLMKLQKIF